jgi:predicted kinase
MEGALSVAAVDSIASRLARFHEHAREDDRISRFGRPDVIRESVVENFAQTRSALCEHVRPCEAAELEAWQTGFLTAHEDVFVARMRAHRIRECHGDLRLEHVYLDDSGEITVLDGIEFNERFRFIDTSADIAFLSMDLAWHGRADLAERLLATYARDANDYDLFSVVDVYEGYRAHVRAKVSTFVERDERMSWEVRQRAAGAARRYFLLAIAAGRKPLRSQVLVAVGGVIASGKSTVASWIGAELGAPVVDADRTRKHLLGIEPTEHANDAAWVGAYDPAVTARVYREVLRRAGVVLASGRPVVIDASFRSKAMREEVRSLAQQLGVPWKLVECRTPPALCRHRLERRATAESVSDGRLDVFDSFAARFEVIDELNDGEHVVVDTSLPPEETARLVQDSLAAWPRDHGRAPVP